MPEITDPPITTRNKRFYIVIAVVIMAIIIGLFIFRAVNASIDDQPDPRPTNNAETNQKDTPNTTNNGTSEDRNVPSSSGSGGNTLLNGGQ